MATTQNETEVLEKPVIFESNGEEVRLTANMVSQFISKGNGKLTGQDMAMFLNLCKYQHLNPFLNEAYLVKFGSSPAQIITSKEAFMKRANADPNYEGFEAGIIVARGDEIEKLNGTVKLPTDKLIGGWATVKRSDRSIDAHVEISLDEFSKGQSTWKTMPGTMIRKSAIVNALREAFPQELGAMYTEDDKNPRDTSRMDIDAKESPTSIDDLISNKKEEPSKAENNDKDKPNPVEKSDDNNAEFTQEEQDIFDEVNAADGR